MNVKSQNPHGLSRCGNRDQGLWNGSLYCSYGVDWDSTFVYVMQLNVWQFERTPGKMDSVIEMRHVVRTRFKRAIMPEKGCLLSADTLHQANMRQRLSGMRQMSMRLFRHSYTRCIYS